MDPNPHKFPLLSFVLSRLPHGPNPSPNPNPPADIEQPLPHAAGAASSPRWVSDHADLMRRMPRLNHPDLLATMAGAVADVAHTRSVLRSLGARPDHETVDAARARIAEIDASLASELEGLATGGEDVAAREKDLRARAERERCAFRAVVQLDEMHEAYEKLLRDAEERLETIYGVEGKGKGARGDAAGDVEMDEEVERILREAQNGKGKGLESVDLSGRQLRFLPEAFGRMRGLVGLDLSNNQLEVIPDAIAGLECLEQLRLASNVLTQLPDSIGLLLNLKILDVSGNKLTSLPDSISQCRSLVELDASYNGLTYLPTNIGYELVNLRKLMVQLNKLRSLPSSICEMRSLEYLDAHFNELRGLPHAFGKLNNLRILDLSSNFSDLTELPESFGELSNLRELNLSNNQIHILPDSFGLLENLVKLNLDQNPIDLPPQEVVNGGAKAVIDFMSKRIVEILEEERRRELEAKTQAQTGWLTRSTSMLSSWASEVSGSVADYLGVGSKSFKDPYLDRQL